MQKIKFLLLIVFLSFFFCPQKIKAKNIIQSEQNQLPAIIISEIMWAGSDINNDDGSVTSSSSDEWIELYNTTDQDINLFDWSITNAVTSNNSLHINQNFKILAHDYFLISNYDFGEKTILNFSEPNKIDYITKSISLNNNNGYFELRNHLNQIIDIVGVKGEKPFFGSNETGAKASMERNEKSSDGTLKESWHTATEAKNLILNTSSLATPKAVNSPSPPDLSNTIIFTEICPNPAGKDSGNEWVKIKNLNPNLINLSGWKIKDQAGTSFSVNQIIAANQEIKIFGLSSINNSTPETLFLYDKYQNLINSISWHFSAPENAVYEYNEKTKKWFWQIPKIDIYKDYLWVSLSKAKKLPLKTKVLVAGIINVSPGIFSNHYFFIQDNYFGLKIYCYENLPQFAVGTIVQVRGYISTYHNQKIVRCSKKSDINIIGKIVLIQKEISNQNFSNYQNQLVKSQGNIVKQGSKYFLNNSNSKIRVYFHSKIKYKKPKYFIGSEVIVIGIIDYFKNEFRLMPRKFEDIKILKLNIPPPKTRIIITKINMKTVKINSPPFVLGKDYRKTNLVLKSQTSEKNTFSSLSWYGLILIFSSFFALILIQILNFKHEKNYEF